ncbi:ATP-binding protein [bacterium]
MKRLQKQTIIKDLQKKIIFLVGPRQVGKTWLAKDIGKSYENTLYLNYDSPQDRDIIKNEAWIKSTELLILDELHKMADWKNYIKGVYDTKPDNLKIIVTGSARLDTFRQTGDSLAGRFFCHRLLPFSLAELKDSEYGDDINRFIERGGFPEPFLASNDAYAKRWRRQYIDGLIRTDLLDFDQIQNFKAIKLVFELLRRRVGSPISYLSISQDVGVTPNTVKKYIQILEALYIVFSVRPYSKNIARSLLKEPKIYFFDTGLVEGDVGIKLENMVAVSLLKNVYAQTDCKGDLWDLHYMRTKEGKEVDFCVVKNGDLVELIEVKYRDNNINKGLQYFCEKYDFRGIQLVQELKREKEINGIEIRDAKDYLKGLFM